MLVEHARELVVEAVGHCRVGLEQHPYPEPVEIHSGYQRHLRLDIGLRLDYRREGGHFQTRKTELPALASLSEVQKAS